MIRDEIVEFPYQGVINRVVYGEGDEEDTVLEIYNGVMDETTQRDLDGRTLQTAPYVVSIPLVTDAEGNYIIPKKGDEVTVTRYGDTIQLTVDNSEPSQLKGVSIYCTRKKW